MTASGYRGFAIAIAIAIGCGAWALKGQAAAQSGASERQAARQAERQQSAQATDTLSPASVPAHEANKCVRFRLLHEGNDERRKQGWYAYNDCKYRVNLTWCPMAASKTKACLENGVGPGTSFRLSPFTDTTNYRALSCFAPKRPIGSGQKGPYSGARPLVCAD